MKHFRWIEWGFLWVVAFLIFSPKVFALAGFAEQSSDLIYNDYAELNWGHPNDGCDAGYPYGQYCFTIWSKNELEKPLHEYLRQISIPSAQDFPIALIESGHSKYFGQGIWVIYDLESKGIIFETEDFKEALKRWESLGFSGPKFASAFNLSDYFPETKESKTKNREEDFDFMITLIRWVIISYWKFLLSLIFLFILFIIIKKRFYKKVIKSQKSVK